MIGTTLLGGCQAEPHAAIANRNLGAEEHSVAERRPAAERVLTASESRQLHSEFQNLAAGHTPVSKLQRAQGDMRWSDLKAAVAAAADEVEMVVVRVHEMHPNQAFEFTLRTIEDFPATLRVESSDGDSVYRAQASVGVFANRTDRAEALLKALERHMLAFGRKRSLDGE